jgi:nucleotide-binding universal stress UspA family protein
MPVILDRPGENATLPTTGHRATRPVVLGTLAVRVDANAERMALESALEAGVRLIVANMISLPPYPMTLRFAPEYVTLPHEEDLDAVRATAQRAAELGIPTELLRITTMHPVQALIELVKEREAGLLVFGPERSKTSRLRFWAAARAVRAKAPCLVWIAPDG